MELPQLGFLEELLAPRKDTWSALSTSAFSDMLFPASSTCWNFDPFVDNPSLATSSPSSSFVAAFSATTTTDQRFECPFTTTEPATYPFAASDDGFTMPELDSSYPPTALTQQNEDHVHHNPSSLEDNNNEDGVFLGSDDKLGLLLEERKIGCCKVEEQAVVDVPVVFNMGLCDGGGGGEKKPRPKKLEGQPSKNLMAERRRRKRLNDRLSMLRSIVPKISKMDRTSILGDTIDYMKELLERISKLQEEEEVEDGTNQINLLGISKELKPNEVMVRNSPKFDVERRDQDTRISICCATKPGLLLSTVNTLEVLGLEIQQCVISSFNDFSMQASCSEVAEQRNCINPEEIKQALFRNAGYGGRCL